MMALFAGIKLYNSKLMKRGRNWQLSGIDVHFEESAQYPSIKNFHSLAL